MARETKIGMLVGLGVILLIGIIVSDHLAAVDAGGGREIAEFGQRADAALTGEDATSNPYASERGDEARPTGRTAAEINRPIPSPDELDGVPGLPAGSFDAPPPMDLRAMRSVTESAATSRSRSLGESLRRSEAAATNSILTFSRDSREAARFEPDPEPAADTSRPNEAAASDAAPDEGVIHYLKEGETLSDVARRYLGDADAWPAIVDANRRTIENPDRVSPGVRLIIPADGSRVATSSGAAAGEPDRPVDATTPSITVQSGDTLFQLAEDYLGDGERWGELLEHNRDRLESARSLRAGMKLKLPPVEAPARARSTAGAEAHAEPADARVTTYTVRSGDTLALIARRVLGDADRWRDLYHANRDVLSDPDAIRAGQTLKVPG